ncbi:MAG: hypothetical protein KIT60_21945 [Burkholderiaceae bacterium]|nr:hypothetical protein [Burkholderiaceae bacterium]
MLAPPTVANSCALAATQVSGIAARAGITSPAGRDGAEGHVRSEAEADRVNVPGPVHALMAGGAAAVLVGIAVGESGEDALGKWIVALGALAYLLGRLFVWSLVWRPPHSRSGAILSLESELLRAESRHLHAGDRAGHFASAAPVLRSVGGRRRQGLHARRALSSLERAARFRAQRGASQRPSQRANAGGWWVV